MSQSKPPDNAQLSRLAAHLRVESQALLVLVIRVNDVAFSVDPSLTPKDAGDTISNEIPSLVQHLAEQRRRPNAK